MTQFEEKLLAILEREAVEFNEHHYEGLCRIAQAINNLADAVKEEKRVTANVEGRPWHCARSSG